MKISDILTCVAMMFWQLRWEVRLQLNIISGKYSHRKEIVLQCPAVFLISMQL